MAEPEAFGVPEITPVEVFRESPNAVNSLPPVVMEYDLVPEPPEATKERVKENPLVPVRPDDGVVMDKAEGIPLAAVEAELVPAPLMARIRTL